MTNCYLCNTEINSQNRSVEHIIPDSLGGRLTSSELLCINCNSKLGRDIDSKFVKTFEPLICTLNILGRENKLAVDCNILFDNNKIPGIISNKKILPKKPFFKRDGTNVTFYGSKKIFKKFKGLIIKDALKDSIKYPELNIKIIDDFQGFFEVEFNIDNEVFNKSLTKIAINYAIHKGISRELLNDFISTEEKMFNPAPSIFYFPQTDFEKILEKTRSIIDVNFPNHNLVLFSEKLDNGKKTLVCYVELFSTFQYYVILSYNYDGKDLFESYFQRVLKDEVINYSVDENALNHKSILPDLQTLESLHPSVNLNFDDPKKVKRIMETYLSQPVPYIGNYSNNLQLMYDNLCLPFLYMLKPDDKLLRYINLEIVELLKEFPKEVIINAYFQMHRHYYILTEDKPDVVIPQVLRRIIENKSGLTSVFSILTPQYMKEHISDTTTYGHDKFYQLMRFVNKQFFYLKSHK
ncbi:MAG: HNH endonuclease [Nanoarchaeota archaeon]